MPKSRKCRRSRYANRGSRESCKPRPPGRDVPRQGCAKSLLVRSAHVLGWGIAYRYAKDLLRSWFDG